VIGKIARGAGIALAVVAVVAVMGAVTLLMGPLPARRGRVVIPQLSAPVDARFDARGIPHVRSVLEVDAWRALGFVHAADRLFQMELRRRAAAGRLAELLGPAAVARDRDARIRGYAAAARRDWEILPEHARAALTAYADGVNAFLIECSPPLELRALSLRPEPWTPLDSLAFGRLMQDGLSVAPDPERAVFDDARARGLAAAVALADAAEPGTTRVSPEIVSFLASMTATARASIAPSETAPAGSNAWALAGTRTASGKPLLAGDPHLNAERPGVWYAAHLTTADGLDVAGLTLPGVPGIEIGHNGRVAWSLTMHQADDSDFYVEQVDWARGVYRRGDAWVPLERRTETIHVKGGADVIVQVDRTVHGPIVLRPDDGSGWALSQAFAPADLPQGPQAFLDAARARTGADLAAAFSQYAGPSVNVCWADVTGAVGVKVAGAVPRRTAGDGRFPVPGWDPAYDWSGTIAPAELPSMPAPDGLVVTANDDWSASSRILPYPGVFAESDRAERARQLATNLRAARVADMRTMQIDVFSPYAARVVAALESIALSDPQAVKARSILTRWNARAETTGPSRLFYAFMKEARKAAGGGALRVTWSMLETMIAGRSAQEFWDDPATPAVETRAYRVEAALAHALGAVGREGGMNVAHWSWGKAHRLSYPHPFASVLPAAVARRLAFGPVGLPGEWHTLDVAGFPLRGDRYDVSDIPSARLIVDLGAPDDSRLVLPLGQSGQLFDRHGHDQLQAWASGRDFPLPFSAKAVEAATISTLRFVAVD